MLDIIIDVLKPNSQALCFLERDFKPDISNFLNYQLFAKIMVDILRYKIK